MVVVVVVVAQPRGGSERESIQGGFFRWSLLCWSFDFLKGASVVGFVQNASFFAKGWSLTSSD